MFFDTYGGGAAAKILRTLKSSRIFAAAEQNRDVPNAQQSSILLHKYLFFVTFFFFVKTFITLLNQNWPPPRPVPILKRKNKSRDKTE